MLQRRERIARIIADIRSQPLGSVVANDRLLGVPEPMPAEAFSSWCWRAVQQLGCTSATFLRSIGIDVPAFWVDAGRGSPDFERISAVVMHPLELFNTFSWSQGSLLSQPELACLTAVLHDRRPIYRFCDNCLREDSVPHIRQLWRQAYAYICPVHSSVLRDLCPHCQKFFCLPKHRAERGASAPSIRECRHCGKDVADCPSVYLPQEFHYYLLGRQTELLGLIGSESQAVTSLGVAQVRTGEHFLTDENGVIDVAISSNRELLFRHLLAKLVTNGGYVTRLKTCPPTLERFLFRVEVKPEGQETISLAIGLDSTSLFGGLSRPIFSAYLHGLMGMHGGTFWSEFNIPLAFQADLLTLGTWIEECGAPAWRTRRFAANL